MQTVNALCRYNPKNRLRPHTGVPGEGAMALGKGNHRFAYHVFGSHFLELFEFSSWATLIRHKHFKHYQNNWHVWNEKMKLPFHKFRRREQGILFFFPSLISTHSLKFRDVFWFRRLFGQKLVTVTTNLQISIRKPWPQIFIGITSKKPSILLMFHLENRSFYNAMSQLVGPVHDQFIEVENGPHFPHTGWSGK